MKKREPRRTVLVAARMCLDGGWQDVRIHNMSAHGLMVEAPGAPARGAYVDIRRGRHLVIGRVVWRHGRHFGVRTQDRLDIDAIVNDPRTRPQPAGEESAERRAAPRARDPGVAAARRLERSRRIASLVQYGTLALFGVAAAGYAAIQVHALLSAPAAAVERALSGGAR